MWFHKILIVLLSVLDQMTASSEKRLIKKLLDNYEKAGKIGRPVKNTKETMVVGFGLSLFQLMDLDEKNQILTTNVWTKYTWTDQLLRWNPETYSNIREVRIPPEHIWTPDIVLYNYADERLKEQRDVMLNVDFNGRVFWSPPAIFKSNCPIDIRNFPFDYQYCFLRFASWTQHSEQLDLQFFDNMTEVDVDQYTPNNEWTLTARPAKRFLMMSEQCGKTIPDLTFFLFLQRNPAFYGYLLVFPCVLLSLLTTVIFWLPPHISAKMILSYYYCLNMVLLSLTTLFSTVIINLHTYSHHRYDVPNWLVKCVDMFAVPLILRRQTESDSNSRENLSVMKMRILKQHLLEQALIHHKKSVTVTNSDPNIFQFSIPSQFHDNSSRGLLPKYLDFEYSAYKSNEFLRENLPLLSNALSSHATSTALIRDDLNSTRRHLLKTKYYSKESDESTESSAALSKRLTTRRGTIQIQTSLSDLRDALKNLMDKISKKESVAKRAREWRFVVMTMDRMFFYFYLCVIISAGFFLLLPRGQNHTVDEILRMHGDEYLRRNKEIAAECLSSVWHNS